MTKQTNNEFPVLISRKSGKKTSQSLKGFGFKEIREPIAIIGLSGRYPQAKNIEAFWDNLMAGKDCITEIPAERWRLEGFYHSNPEEAVSLGKSYSKWGGFVEDFADFDPLFFSISPREALNMDPQERLFIESCWEVMEDAGYTREQLALKYHGRVGVFAGITKTGFDLYGPDLWKQGESIVPYTSFSSVANRVSYLFNLQGPSMPIDTMCSSSLTAIHEACEHLYRGECEMAIAGGVNLYLHPSTYIVLCGQQMLSRDGQCKSFGKNGNGFVPGEGVGTVLLKPLSRAEADGDHIYAVIRGTSINHGGKTNGYTVPNPVAQGELIRNALEKSGVNARTVSYIEAHGTGTELGDPIEITGLTQAFRKDTEDMGYCAIGSVKSNIGHLEAAAGIAGLTKIILQMKHRQLVSSLHVEELNPNIHFIKTPFIVQQELTEWERPVVTIDGETREYPRIAGISSFGAGGSNAHAIIEEYTPPERKLVTNAITAQNPAASKCAIIILSAKNEERLKEQAEQLFNAIQARQFTDEDLADLAYTLQVGREAMEERLGFVTHSKEELAGKLAAFLAGRDNIEDLYRGQVKRNQETLAILTTEVEMQEVIQKWIEQKKYGKLLDLWVKGLVFDWQRLYSDIKPRRISLPTYPFAKESYWIPEHYWIPEIETKGFVASNSRIPTNIHPLLQQNTSDLSEQRYSSTFTGKEFFFADHIVNGKKILPGVAYLEMARAAVELATGTPAENRSVIQLKNVVWARPIEVGKEPVQIHIGIYPGDNGELNYEIYSLADADEAEVIVYNQGTAAWVEVTENRVLDIKALQSECCRQTLSGSEIYNIFKTIGLVYGPGHQGIGTVYVGQGLVLAKLSLPLSVASSEKEFVLHPSIMDAALQATIGIEAGEPGSTGTPILSLPFALQEMEVYNRCTGSMWAILQYSAANTVTDKVRKLDIDICDEQGQVCVQLKGFSSRVLEGGISETDSTADIGNITLEPVWQDQADVKSNEETKALQYSQHLVILCEPEEINPESIEGGFKGVRCLSLQSKQKSIAKRFEAYAVKIFDEIQKIFIDKPKGKVLIQIVVANQGKQHLFAGLAGILKTTQLENPKVIGQVIEIDEMKGPEEIIAKLKENCYWFMDNHIRYSGGKRQIVGWSEVIIQPETAKIPWRDGGIYLITGGAGGLGMIFAQEITQQVKDVTLILTGRSMLDENKQARLEKLKQNGAKIEYRAVDINDYNAVCKLIRSIEAESGKLDGIIHSAGVIRDNYIIKKTSEELMKVLAPKVIGLENLDLASKDLDLDFMILFSSITGSLGNPGQADYAAANAFIDVYARYRNGLVNAGQRRGKTLSINWPLWQEGGMQVTETVQTMMRQSTGMTPLQTSTGIRSLYQGMASGRTQVMVLEGDIQQIRATFLNQPVPSQSMNSNFNQTRPESETAFAQEQLREKTSNYLKKLLSPVIKLSVERIEADTPFEKYGIDSIMVMELTNQLEKTFGSLSKTLFFEYQTIQELSGYFLESYHEQINQLLGIDKKKEAISDISTMNMAEAVMPVIRGRKKSRFTTLQPIQDNQSNRPLDIAIIGVSGRYPQARNLQEFWQNLRNGKDCITEIPKERWDHNQYFDEDKGKPGKTYSKWGGFLEGVDQFDPLFFNIAPPEAEFMDPQERLFLECVYETLEDAGYTRENLSRYQGLGLEGNVGVYVGVMYEEYQLYGAQAQSLGFPMALSGNPSSIANRVSYFCNFHGPSIAVDTMCSSSLTAIHLACQSIQRGGCQLAIAGGVNVSIHPNKYLGLGQGEFVSSKGRCESFGLGGDGYVPGEGVGALLLKPLSKAIADGDHIYGVIKGTAINHGGKTNGYTVPNPNAQAEVIGQALQEAGIDPRTISYIEAHGTGTSLGDPIEITGLVKAFQKYTKDQQFCAIGSAKSNIGHCESAAGIAGITKVLLQLKNRQIVPSLHSKVLNPNIDFPKTPFIVQQELMEWERPVIENNGIKKEYPRRAGVSSFGAGGSNAHIVIEEYIPEIQKELPVSVNAPSPAIILLSAKDGERLKEQAERLLNSIEEQQFTDADLVDIAYTLQVGREAMEERLGLTAGTIQELTDKLKGFIAGRDNIEELYYEHGKRSKEALAVFTTDEDLQKAVETWITKEKYTKILDLWVKGLAFDWNRLYEEKKPLRISLPTYPFAKERYWLPGFDSIPGFGAGVGTAKGTNSSRKLTIRRLFQQNNANFSEQRFDLTESKPVSVETLMLQFGWSEQPITVKAPALEYIQRLVILCEMRGMGTPGEASESLENGLKGTRCLVLQSKQKAIDKRFQNYVIQVFDEIQGILKDQPAGNVLVQVVVPCQGEEQLCGGLVGFIKTARSENPKLTGQLIEVDPMENSAEIITKLEENRRAPQDIQIRYQDGKRWVTGWTELKTVPEKKTLPWKDGGVYLITGGAGGLGLIFAGEIAGQVKNATLILTGRSLPSVLKLAQIKELEGKCRVVYRQVDVSDKKAVDGLIQSITEEYGGLQGIIHSAGLIRDNYIFKKTKEEIIEVLAPKVSGLVNLDLATRDLKFDFFIFFSSMSSVIGNAGQADYSTANAFMDAYAVYRNSLVALGQRHGRTLAINWPLWKEGGISLNQESRLLITEISGLIPMNTRTGIQALYQGMNSGKDQVMVLEGDIQKFQAMFFGKPRDLNPSKMVSGDATKQGRRPEMKGFSLEQCLEWDLKGLVNRVLRIPRDRIDRDKNLAEFGFNSLSLSQLAIQLVKKYGISLTPALFFDYSTVAKLTRYFISESYDTIREYYGEENYVSDSASTPVVSGVSETKKPGKLRFITRDESSSILEPIAIIGMSGRFPGAQNIDELWSVLANGQDMVKEIPSDRFDWRQYYGDPSQDPDKTNCKWYGSISGVREFDPMFFEISPREAETMDPRQRLLLQESWKALEDAGYGPTQIKAQTIGMFVGVEQGDYQFLTRGEGDVSSNNNAILAARLAYFLNLSGPVMAIDTACSSGLVAAHQAILSLRNGECSTAIAAGATLLLTPMTFIGMGQAGMLSKDGKCFAFDKRANGLVPGEAVVAVVLKRLSRAKADGDPIYAVIRGSGINYDGKTNGITAPSGASQTALLKSVYEHHRVNPEDIEYIVTHGTGTRLGDSIEINALYNAFKGYTQKQNYCALTSTKTNFGHALGTSGLVSLISLVQAIRHQTIPASLHCEQENDDIKWQESPFYVNKTSKPWLTNGKTLTGRVGAVSAFGMSGTNAHMVVESYSEEDNSTRSHSIPGATPWYLLAFSAKTPEALAEKIQDMLKVFENKDIREQNLALISYTLLEGRYHFNYRCAMVVQDREHAIYVLKQFLNMEKTPNVLQGKVPQEFTGQKAIAHYGQDLLSKSLGLRENSEKYQETVFALADLYCQGYPLNWQLLFGELKPERVHIPTYPFAKESYWVPEDNGVPEIDYWTGRGNNNVHNAIHPLLQQNTSVLSEQRYSSTFSGEEFFLADYQVHGMKTLPGVASLEMARAAVAASSEKGQSMIRLKNVKWSRPIVMEKQPLQIHIGLYLADNDEIVYEIYHRTVAEEEETVVYGQGYAVLANTTAMPVLDIKTFQAECNQGIVPITKVYETYQAMGVHYGPGYQGIEQIYVGLDQGLAKISIPLSVADTEELFGLHPSIMEGALQAAVGMMKAKGTGNINIQPFTPFALQEMEVYNRCTGSIWALLKYCKGSTAADKSQKFDIDFCDERGTVLVRMKGLEIQADIETEAASFAETSFEIGFQNDSGSKTEEAYELMTFEEVWQKETFPDKDIHQKSIINPNILVCFLSNPENQRQFTETIQTYDQQTRIIFISQSVDYQEYSPQNYGICRTDRNTYDQAFRSIREDVSKDSQSGEVAAVLYLWPLEDSGCIEDYSCIVHIFQAISTSKLNAKRVQFAAQFNGDGPERCYAESWIGFERSLRMILPNIQISAIYQTVSQQSPVNKIKDLGHKIWIELQNATAQSVLYEDNERLVCRVRPTTIQAGNNLLKPGGTYLITGGCGGLGILFARHLAKLSTQAEPVNLILTGRSPLDAEKQSKINELEAIGSRVIYLQADVGDLSAMREGLRRAKDSFGNINGVIHAAGINGTQVIFENDFQNFEKVLEPKVKGAQVLDELLTDEPLDFICYFSSTSAVIGDFGSCDYSIANRFLMTYAHYRNRQQHNGVLRGKAVVINWPLWRDGGMGFGDPENTKMYLKSSGQRFLEAEEGLTLFERILAQNNTQSIVFTGQPQAVHRFLGLTKERPATLVTTTSLDDKRGRVPGRRPEMKGFSLEQCLEWDLKWFINRLLKIPREKIDREKNLAEFGFNSIGLTQFSIQLIKHFGINEITPVLFFMYPTIEKISQYLLTQYPAVIQEFYQEDAGVQTMKLSGSVRVSAIEVMPKQPLRRLISAPRFTGRNSVRATSEPIAVIGMSGRFPNSDTVEELWNNLINGRNCIGEIPKERWDWREYYGDPQQEPNKTNSKWGGFIAGVDRFDPQFFDIPAEEAEYMDPKQRLFLEEAWRCLEDAGYMGERIYGKKCGVYAGVEEGEYGYISGGGLINSNQNATLPARIAYQLNLKGPNLALTASCSSGLVAIHQACQALRQGDCEMALVGAVNLMITPMIYIGMSQAGMLSPDGQCYVFDQRANGMVPGEAAAVVLLKPLSKAVSDHDHIYGCIKASGVNYNGKGNGITAPNPLSQAELIQDIYDKYSIHPETIQYIIPQSVGSKLGDSMEIQVLTDTFAKYTTKKQYCTIGSVKPLIGHTFAASGVVSLMSMLMAMKHRTIPAMKNYETCNEYIDFKNSPFTPSRENREWVSPGHSPRVGAISTTGTNGTNAHAVVEEYLPEQATIDNHPTQAQIIVLSAKNQDRLQAIIQRMLAFVEWNSDFSMADMAYTLQVGREPMVSRLAMVVKNKQELINGLRAYLNNAGRVKKAGNLPYYTGDLESDPAEMRDLLSGKAAEAIVELFLKEKNLEKIAHYWVKGGKIPWEAFHEGETVRRIPLPTYPFAGERYWVQSTSPMEMVQETATLDEKVTSKIDRNSVPEKNPASIEPRDEIETALAEIFCKVLNVQSVSIQDNFFRLGGNSLAVIKALDMITEKLNQRVRVKDFYSYSTIEELGRVMKEGRSTDEIIDLTREAVLEDDILPCGEISVPADGANILLTGCTGFVGRFLLYDLLDKTTATIYCMVRAGSKSEALKRIKAGLREFELWKPGYEQRIIPVTGDLSQPNLGIASRIYQSLTDNIDVIFHCATYMNHLTTYREMKKTTVDGVKRILRFACTGKQKILHYISTLSVFNTDKSRIINEMTPIEQEVHYNSAGYAASKWVADKLMMLAWERGIPGNIYRLGLVAGDSQKGRYDKAQSFYRALQTYLEIGCYNYDNQANITTFVPVDYIAKAIVYLARRPDINQVYHLTNNQIIDFLDIIKFYNRGAEKPINIVSTFELCRKIKEAMRRGETPPLLPIIGDFLDLSEEELQSVDWNPSDRDLYAFRDVDPTRTLNVLKEGGIQIPAINEELIKKYFDYIARNMTNGS